MDLNIQVFTEMHEYRGERYLQYVYTFRGKEVFREQTFEGETIDEVVTRRLRSIFAKTAG